MGGGGRGSDPIHNFATHFFVYQSYEILGEKGGEGGSITLIHFLQKSSFKYGHFKCFWKVLFFPFFVTKIKCVAPVP